MFSWLQSTSRLETAEFARTFNAGIGMIAIIAADAADLVQRSLASAGQQSMAIGEVKSLGGDGQQVMLDGSLRFSQ